MSLQFGLARRLRPQKFADVIGQESIVKALSNAIVSKSVPQGIILSGIRGIGKTTFARIIAKSLNCSGEDKQSSETVNPCGICKSCVSVIEEKHLDVIEIDAASRTGVDDIRNIIENVKYKPVMCRYKIFIIDEVHMLSKSAFNALLKTLEEPPAHVKFIFATTEVNKVPATVLSRCMRFDLKRINTKALVGYMSDFLKEKNVEYDVLAIELIAYHAQGSLRDALSLLEQCLIHNESKIILSDLLTIQGQTKISDLEELLTFCVQKDIKKVLDYLERLYNQSMDPLLLVKDILELLHQLSCYHLTKDNNTVSVIYLKACQNICAVVSLSSCQQMWQVFLKGYEDMKKSPIPYSTCRMLFIQACLIEQIINIDKLSLPTEEQKKKS